MQASDDLAVCKQHGERHDVPGNTLNLTQFPCVAAEITLPSACVEIEPRLGMVRPYIHGELLLEVDEGDARFCNDVAFFNVDLGRRRAGVQR